MECLSSFTYQTSISCSVNIRLYVRTCRWRQPCCFSWIHYWYGRMWLEFIIKVNWSSPGACLLFAYSNRKNWRILSLILILLAWQRLPVVVSSELANFPKNKNDICRFLRKEDWVLVWRLNIFAIWRYQHRVSCCSVWSLCSVWRLHLLNAETSLV